MKKNNNKYDVYLVDGKCIRVSAKILPLKYDFNKNYPKRCTINTNSMRLRIGYNGEIYNECRIKTYGNLFENAYNFDFNKQETIEYCNRVCRYIDCSTTQRTIEY